MVSKESLNELSAILREEFGQELPPHEVFAIAQGLLGFFGALSRLDSENKNEHENERMGEIL